MMRKKTDEDRRLSLDETDRKLLSLLSIDCSQSYSELGLVLHLSAPAVHERVKKLKQKGVITAQIARLDSNKIGRPLLCFVQVITSTIERTRQVAALSSLTEIEEIHTVTGESGLLLKVRTRDPQGLEDVLNMIHRIEGVDGTRTQIVLSTLLERGPSPILTT